MSKKKKLTPAQREKKLQAEEEKKMEKKKAAMLAAGIAIIAALAVVVIGIVIATGNSDYTATSGQNGTTTPAAQTVATDPLPTGDGAPWRRRLLPIMPPLKFRAMAPSSWSFTEIPHLLQFRTL